MSTSAGQLIPEIPGHAIATILHRKKQEKFMTNERNKTRAQYLNSLAVAVLTLSASAVISGAAPVWAMPLAGLASLLLHMLAVKAVAR